MYLCFGFVTVFDLDSDLFIRCRYFSTVYSVCRHSFLAISPFLGWCVIRFYLYQCPMHGFVASLRLVDIGINREQLVPCLSCIYRPFLINA